MKTRESAGQEMEYRAFPKTLTIGIDLGDRFGHYCILDQKGVVVEEGRVKMTRKEVTVHFQRLATARIAMEAGTHSGWVSRLLEGFGHEVLVANVCETPGISHSHSKSDLVDAEKLARYARVDPRLLSPIRHRTEEAQHDLVLIRVPNGLFQRVPCSSTPLAESSRVWAIGCLVVARIVLQSVADCICRRKSPRFSLRYEPGRIADRAD